METVWILDGDGEEFVFENEWDIAIPVDLLLDGDRLRITCFPCVEQEVRAWFDRFCADVFSEKALRALTGALIPVMKEKHYAPEPRRHRWGYLMRREKAVVEDAPHIKLLSPEDEERNLTGYDIEASLDEGCIGFGAEEGGKIVALAMTHSEPDDTAEIGVETVKGYRGKGYASACLCALSAHLEAKGCTAEYRCFTDNVASVKTAEKAGYAPQGKYYYFVLRHTRETVE